VVGRRVGDG